ncbi:hypothetical protein MKW98_012598 [Papaver atlanticum]|uniref:Uncharacterized protein n=1 Tax=Papaver atlanticum TaxID=357466 RepID=A0AAD4T3I2_9MAGN|nr:hypothetical protein MKW98_012598 [Papaver atlanticum]
MISSSLGCERKFSSTIFIGRSQAMAQALPSDVENSQAMVNQLPTFASRLWFYPRTNLPTYRGILFFAMSSTICEHCFLKFLAFYTVSWSFWWFQSFVDSSDYFRRGICYVCVAREDSIMS